MATAFEMIVDDHGRYSRTDWGSKCVLSVWSRGVAWHEWPRAGVARTASAARHQPAGAALSSRPANPAPQHTFTSTQPSAGPGRQLFT